MNTLEQEIQQIKDRNIRVEADKAWETSYTRKFIIIFLTYSVIVIFFHFTKVERPFVNAIVPSVGFFISTLTLGLAKKLWLRKYKK